MRPWLVCVTTRPGVDPIAPVGRPQRATRARAARAAPPPRSSRLVVAAQFALSIEAVGALAARSGGNPLFVRELVFAAQHGHSLDELPETVESLLTTRIDTLDPADRMLLRYAAVVGPTFDLDAARRDPGRRDPRCGTSRSAGADSREFVVPADAGALALPPRPRPRHRVRGPLVPPAPRRSTVASARSLEHRAGEQADEQAALLSLHFFEAGDHDRAWRYGVIAGERAQASFANIIAAELFERALAAAEHLADVGATEQAPGLRAARRRLRAVRRLRPGGNRLREGAGTRSGRSDHGHAPDGQDGHGLRAFGPLRRRARGVRDGARPDRGRRRRGLPPRFGRRSTSARRGSATGRRGTRSRSPPRSLPSSTPSAPRTRAASLTRATSSTRHIRIWARRTGCPISSGRCRSTRSCATSAARGSCSTTSASTPTTRAAGRSRSSSIARAGRRRSWSAT